jgi:hemolysin III
MTSIRKREPRPLAQGERIADLWVHGLAIGAGLVGVVALMAVALPQGSPGLTLGTGVYAGALLAMLICSALYNGGVDNEGDASPRRDLLRRLDHAAIFVMIAGTYTPFLAMQTAGAASFGLLIYVWAVAGVGAAIKLVWSHRFERLSVVIYLFLGWTIVVAVDELVVTAPLPTVVLLAAGGVLYTVGVLFHLWERLPYQQPIWHAFVVAAAACHYAAILTGVALPGAIG